MTAPRRITPAIVLFAGAAAASTVLLIVWQSHLAFLIDEWDPLIHRNGFTAHSLLDQHANHLIVGPVLIYKAIQHTLGMDSQVPYAVASVILFIASVAMLFVYLRSRLGDWVALAAVLPVLVMGTAYEDLLSTFQMSYTGSVAFGIGALITIERDDRRGDVLTCILLLASLAFAEVAIGFTAAVIVGIALQHGPLRRAWVPAVPIVLYAAWYVTFRHDGLYTPNSLSVHNIATSFPYVLDGFASSLGSLFGLGSVVQGATGGGIDWGRPLLVLAIALVCVWGLRSGRPFRGWVLVPVIAGITFWFLTAANYNFARPPYAGRYQYVGAVFLLLIAAELGARWRPRPDMLVAIFAVAAAAALGNFGALRDGYRQKEAVSSTVRGGLSGLEIAADTVSPSFVLTFQNSGFNSFGLLTAKDYLPAEKDFGSPAYTQGELAEAPEAAREAADKVMAAALPIRVQPLGAAPRSRLLGRCTLVTPSRGSSVAVLPPGGALLDGAPGASEQLRLRRFASGSFPVSLGTLRGVARLEIPRDASARPWELRVIGTGSVRVCVQ